MKGTGNMHGINNKWNMYGILNNKWNMHGINNKYDLTKLANVWIICLHQCVV